MFASIKPGFYLEKGLQNQLVLSPPVGLGRGHGWHPATDGFDPW